jgi:NitT/TauT family transport system substrate-binding protein
LNSTREFIDKNPQTHQKVMNALEKASQYIYAFPQEAVKIGTKEFPDLDPEIVKRAVERMTAELAYPEHVFADIGGWNSNQKLHKFVGTVKNLASVEDGIDNRAALVAYRTLGRIRWSGPRPIVKSVTQ